MTVRTGRSISMERSSLPLVVAALVLGAGPALAQEEPLRTVGVSGEGVVRAEPDQATVRFGVVSRDPDPEAARQQNADASARAMNAVRDLGVQERKIQLETLRLQPVREYDRRSEEWVEKGFEAIRVVRVQVDDLTLIPQLVAQIVQVGANRLEGVAYGLSDEDEVRNEALRQAVRNAREKAALMAGELGAGLGPVQTIEEESVNFPRPQMRAMAQEAMVAADPEPDAYAAGEIEVRARVRVVFRLVD